MKITIVLGAFLPVPPSMGGAIEKNWFALSREFAHSGHDVLMISRALPNLPTEEVIGGVRHRRVRGADAPGSIVRLKWRDLLYSLRVRAVLPAADILVTHTFWLPILVRDARHGRVYVHVGRIPKGQLRFYSKTAVFHAATHSVARAIADELPRPHSRISLIPNPAPSPVSAEPPPAFFAREKVILFIGRLHPEKGAHLLLAALSGEMAKKFLDWKVVIIGPFERKYGGGGDSYAARLQQTAQQSLVPVTLRGPIFDAAKLEQEYRAARIFVYPSLADRGETFGQAPLEAMSHGCAVLVSALECFRDFIHDGENAFVFNHRTRDPATALARRLQEVMLNESALARVAEAGQTTAQNFSLGKVASQFLEDFRRLQ